MLMRNMLIMSSCNNKTIVEHDVAGNVQSLGLAGGLDAAVEDEEVELET